MCMRASRTSKGIYLLDRKVIWWKYASERKPKMEGTRGKMFRRRAGRMKALRNEMKGEVKHRCGTEGKQ